jgi:NADPH2:quinone reductase
VRDITGGRGVDVVFDSVGRDTFMGSLDSLRRRGLMVCVGTASGTIPPFDPQLLAMKGSLFLTRPALADYIADPIEKALLAHELFNHVGNADIKIDINQHYLLEDAVAAHRDLQSRRTVGSSIFIL